MTELVLASLVLMLGYELVARRICAKYDDGHFAKRRAFEKLDHHLSNGTVHALKRRARFF